MKEWDVDDKFLRVSILQDVREVDQSVSISEGPLHHLIASRRTVPRLLIPDVCKGSFQG
jgi:hypothetical protein